MSLVMVCRDGMQYSGYIVQMVHHWGHCCVVVTHGIAMFTMSFVIPSQNAQSPNFTLVSSYLPLISTTAQRHFGFLH